MSLSVRLKWGQRLLGLILCFAVFQAGAHSSGRGLSAILFKVSPDHVDASLAVSFPDMDGLLRFDKNQDDDITVEEINQVLQELQEVATRDCEISFDQRRVKPSEIKAIRQENNFEIVMKFDGVPTSLLTYRSFLIRRLSPEHQEFVTFVDAQTNILEEFVLTPADNEAQLKWSEVKTITESNVVSSNVAASVSTSGGAVSGSGRAVGFAAFVLSGGEHILFNRNAQTGRYGITDHFLFLLALLLMCEGFLDVLKIVTSFTLAHSVTLALAALGWISISSRVAEPLIAATIVYVGLENIFKFKTLRWRWIVTFAFGLIHGLGFANQFREMFGGAGHILVRLLSFNLGVELGQILVAILLLPVIWQWRKHPKFAPNWIPVASALVVLIGGWWLIDRLMTSVAF